MPGGSSSYRTFGKSTAPRHQRAPKRAPTKTGLVSNFDQLFDFRRSTEKWNRVPKNGVVL
jgi:hypothetical protein